MSERKQVARAAGVVGAMTMISRVFGYLRDAVIATYFGAGAAADAFFVAFRIPNFLRRLFGEGSLTISFVPVFTEALEKEGKERARELASICFTVFSVILALLTLLGIIFAPQIILLLAPGYQGVADKMSLTVLLTRIMFPYTLLICLVALAMGVLNSVKHFFAPAFAPVLLNIAMIFCGIGLYHVMDPPILGLAIGVVAGGVLQLILQAPFLLKKGYFPRIIFRFNDPGLKKIAILMLPAMFGMAVHTFAVFINTIFASLLEEGAVSYLFYADRLMELPLGVFAIAVGAAVLPSMSRQAAHNDFAGLKDTLSYAIRLVMFVSLPAAAGLIALSHPIVNVLFQRGEFDLAATQATAKTLIFFCAGLPFFAALRVIVPTFYSMKNTVTPVIFAAIALFVTLVCDLLFIGPVQYTDIALLAFLTENLNVTGPLGYGGLALATSVGAMVNCLGLIVLLKGKVGGLGGGKIALSFIKSAVASIFMGIIVWIIAGWFDFDTDDFNVVKTMGLIISITCGVLAYALMGYILKSVELTAMLKILKNFFAKKS